MDPKQTKRNDDETIQDVSADEAEKVAGGTKFGTRGDTNEPEPPPPTNDGQLDYF